MLRILEKSSEVGYIFVSHLCKTYALIYIASSLFTFMPYMCMASIVLYLGMRSPLASSALVIIHN